VTGGGYVYIGTMNYGPTAKQNQLIAISQSTGQEVWHYQIDSPILHTAAYDNGSVYFASQNGKVYKVSSAGQLQASRTLTGQIYAAPLIANGSLYIGTTSNFYALNLSNLADKWTPRSLGAEVRATAGYSKSRNYVIVEAQNMHVYALNADSGNTVWDSYVGGQNRVSFEYLYPAISDITDSVIVRTDVTQGSYACYLMPDLTLATTLDGLRQQIGGTRFETFFVLNLTTGVKKYVSPVAYADVSVVYSLLLRP
jgi:outer membrane protein assembly factor BamB